MSEVIDARSHPVMNVSEAHRAIRLLKAQSPAAQASLNGMALYYRLAEESDCAQTVNSRLRGLAESLIAMDGVRGIT